MERYGVEKVWSKTIQQMEMFLDSMFWRLQCRSPLFLISKNNGMKTEVSCYSHAFFCWLKSQLVTVEVLTVIQAEDAKIWGEGVNCTFSFCFFWTVFALGPHNKFTQADYQVHLSRSSSRICSLVCCLQDVGHESLHTFYAVEITSIF